MGSLSNSHHNLFGSLECSDLATYSNFFFEENLNNLEENLVQHQRRLKPDITVITLLPGWNMNPSNQTFAAMADVSPLAFLWFDLAHKFVMDMAKNVEPYAKIQAVLDHPYYIPNSKYITLWTPQDTRVYNDPKLNRDIDVSFLGSVHGYNDRNSYLQHLVSHCGASILQQGGQREHNLSPHNYAKVMQKSKISLNFSKTRSGLQQTKGRLWEVTLCGALLMEDCNLGTSHWFQPFKDYVPFCSNEDLLDKINYYLNNPEKAAEITAEGKRKSENHYSPTNWWNILINSCN